MRSPATLQVLVHRLARDDQVHDLRRALEDAVDAHVAQDLLDRHAAQAAGLQGPGGLVAAAAAHLHERIDDPPAHLGAVELGERGLDAHVVALLVGQPAGHVEHGFEAEGGRGDERDALRHLVVLADRLAPLDALAGELAGDLRRPLADPGADGRQRQAAGVERGQGDLEPLALAADHVLARHVGVGEPGLGVLDPAQPHELDARLDDHAVGRARDDEGGDAAVVTVAAGHLGQHDDDVGHSPVGRPQLAAVEEVARAVLGGRRGGRHPGGVGAHAGLGQREGGQMRTCRPSAATRASAPPSRPAAGAAPARSTGAPTAASRGWSARSRPASSRGCSRPGRARGRRTARAPSCPGRQAP